MNAELLVMPRRLNYGILKGNVILQLTLRNWRRVVRLEAKMTDPDLDKVVETIKRNVPSGSVTMNKLLEPWPVNAFHKTLATHIHNATRPAKHSHLAANYGIMDNEQDARRWDFEGVKE